MPAGSGPTLPTPFAFYDPDSCSWKTSSPCFDLGETTTPVSGTGHRSKRSLQTWPASGMTSAGRAYELPTSAPPTAANGSSSSALRATPTTSDAKGASPGHSGTLAEHIALLPTPAAQEPGGTVEQYRERLRAHDGRESTFTPLSMIVQLLPTPAARDGHGQGTPSRETARRRMFDEGRRNLEDAVALLPTPQASDGLGGRVESQVGGTRPSGSKRSTSLRTALTHGASTSPPSDGGNESSTGPPPAPTDEAGRLNPLFVEWMMGLPAGWVTAVSGVPRTAQLRILGNGVVPQSAAAAYGDLLAHLDATRGAA